jgi:hypothetical protein
MSNYYKRGLSTVTGVAIVMLAVVAFGLPGSVKAFGNPWPLVDTFSYNFLKPHPLAKWWIINWGESGGTQGRFEDDEGPYSSFSIEQEGWKRFARLTVKPQAVSGFYTNVDVAEEHTGFPAEIENEWAPTEHKDVVIEAKVRWSAGFNATGTGGAVGSSGVWLWNSPYDVANYDPFALNRSFGFNYNEAGSYGGFLQGLTFNVIFDNNPIYVTSAGATLNMHDWNTLKSVWSLDNGVESIEFFVNGTSVGSTQLPASLGALSTEIWNDNQHVVFDENGLNLIFENLESDQHFDLDHFALYMLPDFN